MLSTLIKCQFSKKFDILHGVLGIALILVLTLGWYYGVLVGYLWFIAVTCVAHTGWQFRMRYICLKRPQSIIAFEMPGQGTEWRLMQVNGECQIGHLMNDSIALPWILFLHFNLIGKGRQCMVVTAETVTLSCYKEIQRWLKFQQCDANQKLVE